MWWWKDNGEGQPGLVGRKYAIGKKNCCLLTRMYLAQDPKEERESQTCIGGQKGNSARPGCGG